MRVDENIGKTVVAAIDKDLAQASTRLFGETKRDHLTSAEGWHFRNIIGPENIPASCSGYPFFLARKMAGSQGRSGNPCKAQAGTVMERNSSSQLTKSRMHIQTTRAMTSLCLFHLLKRLCFYDIHMCAQARHLPINCTFPSLSFEVFPME
jgi:hypothetical protein